MKFILSGFSWKVWKVYLAYSIYLKTLFEYLNLYECTPSEKRTIFAVFEKPFQNQSKIICIQLEIEATRKNIYSGKNVYGRKFIVR